MDDLSQVREADLIEIDCFESFGREAFAIVLFVECVNNLKDLPLIKRRIESGENRHDVHWAQRQKLFSQI